MSATTKEIKTLLSPEAVNARRQVIIDALRYELNLEKEAMDRLEAKAERIREHLSAAEDDIQILQECMDQLDYAIGAVKDTMHDLSTETE